MVFPGPHVLSDDIEKLKKCVSFCIDDDKSESNVTDEFTVYNSTEQNLLKIYATQFAKTAEREVDNLFHKKEEFKSESWYL